MVRNFRDSTLRIADTLGFGGPNVETVEIMEGRLKWSDRRPVKAVHHRGLLREVRDGRERPVSLSFAVKYRSTQDLRDALTGSGMASGWTTTDTDAYAVDVEFRIADPSGGDPEVITFPQFLPRNIRLREGLQWNTLLVSGLCIPTRVLVSELFVPIRPFLRLYFEPCSYGNGTEPADMDDQAIAWTDGGISGVLAIGLVQSEKFQAARGILRNAIGFVGGNRDVALGDARFSFKITRGSSSSSGCEQEAHGFGGRYFGGMGREATYVEDCTYANGTEPVDMDGELVSWDDGQIGGVFTPIGTILGNTFKADRVSPAFIGGSGDVELGDARFSFKITRGSSSTSGNEAETHGFGGRYFGGINLAGILNGVFCQLRSTSSTQVTLSVREISNRFQQVIYEEELFAWAQDETKWLGFDIVGTNAELWVSDTCDFINDRVILGSIDLVVLTAPSAGEGSLLIEAHRALNETGISVLDDFVVVALPVHDPDHWFPGKFHSGVYCDMVSTSASEVTLRIQEYSNFVRQGNLRLTNFPWAQEETKYLGFDIVDTIAELWVSDTDNFESRITEGTFELTAITAPSVGEGSLLIKAHKALNESGLSLLDDFRVEDM